MQRPDYLRCLLAERIFNTNYRCKAVLDRHIEMRILLRQRIKQLLSALRNRTFLIFKYKVMASDHNVSAFDQRGNAMCNNVFYL